MKILKKIIKYLFSNFLHVLRHSVAFNINFISCTARSMGGECVGLVTLGNFKLFKLLNHDDLELLRGKHSAAFNLTIFTSTQPSNKPQIILELNRALRQANDT